MRRFADLVSRTGDAEPLIWIAIALVAVGAAALPGMIARRRNHPSSAAISLCGVLGLLLTAGFGWLIALIWAYTGPDRSKPRL
jgi:CBS-domain-containing membrane protein